MSNMNRYIRNIGFASLLTLTLASGAVAQQSDTQESDTQPKRDLFGSVVYNDVLDKTVETNVTNALFGELAGLYVMQGQDEYNALNDQATMTIRGNATFGDATPLILVDGIERSLEDIAASEIEKIEVLKDAVASAMYGVKGANGVVLVTTKRGSKGFKAKVSYTSTIEWAFRVPEFVDGATYAQLLNQTLDYEGSPTRYTDQEIEYFINGKNRELYPDVDWLDTAFKNFGYSHLANMEFEGGGEKVQYYANIDYSNTTGILNNTDLDSTYDSQLSKVHFNLLTNIDVKLTKTTTFNVGLVGYIREHNRPGVGTGTFLTRLYDTPASAFPIKTGTGNWGSTATYAYNPIADIADAGTVKVIRRTLLANMEVNQNLDAVTPGLYASIGVSYDNSINFSDSRTRSYQYETLTPKWSDGVLEGVVRTVAGTQSELGWSSTINNQEMSSRFMAQVGYDRTFNTDHNLRSALTYEQVSQVRYSRNSSQKRQSIMATANYDYKGRYFADVVMNYSGSAVLPEGSQHNLYPALGLGWIASQESFLRDNSVVDYLKIRSSFGYSGNDLFSHDLDLQTYGTSGYGYYFGDSNTYNSGLADGDLPVSDLMVERSRKFDVGFDATLLKSLNISASYFNEFRSRILVSGDTTTSEVIGIGVPQICEGEVSNQGVEFALNYVGRVGDFRYSLTGNFTYAKSEIINNNEGYLPNDYLYTTGQSLNQQYGLQSAGFFNSYDEIEDWSEQRFGDTMPGDIKYVDKNGDEVIDELDVVRLGYSNIPEIYYGFNLEFGYKGFSLFAQFQGVAHRGIYLNTTSVNVPLIDNTNISKWYVEDNVAWTPETASTATLPRLTTVANANNYQKNDIWVKSGDYFKLRNVELAYTFDRELINKVGLRVYLRAANLFSIDALGYVDPENYGVAYPTMQSFSIGADLMF